MMMIFISSKKDQETNIWSVLNSIRKMIANEMKINKRSAGLKQRLIINRREKFTIITDPLGSFNSVIKINTFKFFQKDLLAS